MQFDRTYPARLSANVRPEDFDESIVRINSPAVMPLWGKIMQRLAIALLAAGFITFALGGFTSVHSGSTGFPVTVIIGFVMFFFGMISIVISGICGQRARFANMVEAIRGENERYSSNGVSWRLGTLTTGGGKHTYTNYWLEVEFAMQQGQMPIGVVPLVLPYQVEGQYQGQMMQNSAPPPYVPAASSYPQQQFESDKAPLLAAQFQGSQNFMPVQPSAPQFQSAEAARICTSCNSRLAVGEGMRFCPRCGAPTTTA